MKRIMKRIANLRMFNLRRRVALERQMVELFGYLASALESGVNLSNALELASSDFGKPIGSKLKDMCKGMRVGMPVEDVVFQFAESVGNEEARMFAQAVWALRRSGGNLVEVFKRMESAAMERQRVREKARLVGFQVSMEGYLLSSFPIIIAAALEFVMPGYLAPLFDSALGVMVLGFGVLLLSAGLFLLVKFGKVEV